MEIAFMFCETCNTRDTCTKLCDKVNKFLKANGVYSADYIRPQASSSNRPEGKGQNREIPVDDIDSVATQRALYLRGGKKKIKKYAETE